MVYTVTLNPCIDYYMNIDSLTLHDVNRSTNESLAAGGKGINVSHALTSLGVDNVATGIIGGVTAPLFLSLMQRQGLKSNFISSPNFVTRINPKIRSTSGVTECNGGGAEMSLQLFERMKEKLDAVSDSDTVVISGNKPPCDIRDVYGELIRTLKKKNVYVIADTSGDELLNAARAKADMLKPNASELCRLYGTSDDIHSLTSSARRLMDEGAGSVLVSMGDKGAVLFVGDKKYMADIPMHGNSANTVGAGDCCVAGYVYALLNGADDCEKLSRAVAAGTARTCSASFFERDIFNKLKNTVKPYIL